jgi:hypothetical protein
VGTKLQNTPPHTYSIPRVFFQRRYWVLHDNATAAVAANVAAVEAGVAGRGAVVADACTSSVVVVGFGMALATGSEHSAAAAVAAVGVSTSVVVVEIWIAVAPGKKDSVVAAAAAAAAASVDTGFARVQDTARWDIPLGELDIEVVGLKQQCPDAFFDADMTSP